ncbi:MAG: tetratricopeptide repeat protein [Brevinematales bacterium]|nr:tetratricopeptide repeat protein [Brevinematales bacterium]
MDFKKVSIIGFIGLLIIALLVVLFLIIRDGSSNRDKLISLAKIYIQEGDYSRALDYLDKLYMENPSDEEVSNLRKEVMKRKRIKEEEMINRQVKVKVEVPDISQERQFQDSPIQPLKETKGKDKKEQAEEIYKDGITYLRKGDINNAHVRFEKANELDPENSKAKGALSYTTYRKGNPDRAIKLANEVMSSNPDEPYSHLTKGNILYDNNDYDNALNEFNKVLQSGEDDPDMRYRMGIIYYTRKMYNDAVREFKKAVEISPSFDKAYYNLGLSYYVLGDKGEAIKAFNQAISVNPSYSKPYINLGTIYYIDGEYEKALNYFLSAYKYEKNNDSLLVKIGNTYDKLGQPDKAMPFYASAVKINSKNFAALYNLGNSYLFVKEDPSMARKYIEQAYSINKDDPLLLTTLANLYLSQGDIDKASSIFSEIIKKNQNLSEPYAGLGFVYLKRNKSAEAIKLFKKALSINPYDYNALIGMGDAMLNEGLYDDAIEYYSKVRDKFRDSYRALVGLGKSYARKNDFSKAISFYKQAVNVKETPETLFELAVSLEKNGDREEAIVYYRRIKDKYPNFDRMNLVDKVLQNF